MKFNKYILLTLVLIPATTHPMARAKQVLSWLCAGVNVRLALDPAIAEFRARSENKAIAQAMVHVPDASPEEQEFVHEQLRAVGLHKPDTKIKTTVLTHQVTARRGDIAMLARATLPHGVVDVSPTGVIVISRGKDPSKNLGSLLKAQQEELLKPACSERDNKLQEITEDLNRYKFACQRAGIQIKEELPWWNSAANYAITLPWAGHFGFRAIKAFSQARKLKAAQAAQINENYMQQILNPHFKPTPPIPAAQAPKVLTSLKEIGAGAAKYFTSHLALTYYRQQNSQKADDGTVADRDILQGGVDVLTDLDDVEKTLAVTKLVFEKGTNPTPLQVGIEQAEANVKNGGLTPLSRVKKLEERRHKILRAAHGIKD